MYQLIQQIIGSEDEILSFLGYRSDPKPVMTKFDGHFLDDEEFDE